MCQLIMMMSPSMMNACIQAVIVLWLRAVDVCARMLRPDCCSRWGSADLRQAPPFPTFPCWG